ncbi:hypothetical protein [uncultured Ruegeria sp.]|uniref:hypothetical protein n=1 Tax=uncultured Ruegeria sp. TaxID=259304 RepID=UPI002625F3AD|nr:hypothetical protein [uncultured Ruegeria sp.]
MKVYILKNLAFLSALVTLGMVAPALADEIELDWNSVELGFFENTNDAGEVEDGKSVYVPGSRVATADDFKAIIPEFCSSRLEGILSFSKQLEDSPEVSLLKLQIDFYGPKLGEHQTYIGRAMTIDLSNEKCSPK